MINKGPEGMIEQGQERETQWEREESKKERDMKGDGEKIGSAFAPGSTPTQGCFGL